MLPSGNWHIYGQTGLTGARAGVWLLYFTFAIAYAQAPPCARSDDVEA